MGLPRTNGKMKKAHHPPASRMIVRYTSVFFFLPPPSLESQHVLWRFYKTRRSETSTITTSSLMCNCLKPSAGKLPRFREDRRIDPQSCP